MPLVRKTRNCCGGVPTQKGVCWKRFPGFVGICLGVSCEGSEGSYEHFRTTSELLLEIRHVFEMRARCCLAMLSWGRLVEGSYDPAAEGMQEHENDFRLVARGMGSLVSHAS
ncbi:unnamed protein product, partial [Hapterophycus canaliculatus]